MYIYGQIAVGKAGLEVKAQGRSTGELSIVCFEIWQIWCLNWSRSLNFSVPQFT